MSMKNIYIIFVAVFFLACKSSKNEDIFANLSAEEREELATFYHNISITKYHYQYQTGLLHRIYKDSALMAVPDHVEYTQRYSYSYKKSGEHVRAMELLNKAVDTDVANGKTNALEYKAWSMLYFYRDYESAIEDVDQIEQMNSPNPYNTCHGEPCLLLKAQALYQLKKYQEALDCFHQLLKIEEEYGFDPQDNFFARFYIARIYTQQNDTAKAMEAYQSLIDDYENFTEAHYYLGLLYAEQGNKPMAVRHLETAKKLFSENYKVIQEPYIERFDEVFVHQVDEALEQLL